MQSKKKQMVKSLCVTLSFNTTVKEIHTCKVLIQLDTELAVLDNKRA